MDSGTLIEKWNNLNCMCVNKSKKNILNLSGLHLNGIDIFHDIDVDEILKYFTSEYYMEENELIPLTHSVKYQKSLTKEFGLGAFPFHTDGAHRPIPPEFTILQYSGIEKSETGTLFLDSLEFSGAKENEDLFFNEIYLVQYGEKPFLSPLINKQIYKRSIFRFNKMVMKKLINLTSKTLEDSISTTPLRINWTKGKIIIINNWRLLHAREKLVEGEEQIRKIKRYNLTPKN
jgi:hypothetical protein